MEKVSEITQNGFKFKWGKLEYTALNLAYNSHAIFAFCHQTRKFTLIWHNAKIQPLGV